MRLYLDHNVFKAIQDVYTDNEKHRTFRGVVFGNKGRFVIPFSDAHLDDLSASTRDDLTKLDLQFMSEITNDLYLKTTYKERLLIEGTHPIEAFRLRNFEVLKEFQSNPNRMINEIFSFNAIPEVQPLLNVFNTILDMPVLDFLPQSKLQDEIYQQSVDKYFPGLKNCRSLRDFMTSTFTGSAILLNDKEEFSELKKQTQSQIDGNKYGYKSVGASFNELLLKSPINRTFEDLLDSVLLTEQKNDLYLKVWLSFTFLELFNISPDRSPSGGRKKGTLNNMSADANHTFFAATSDYFITEDTSAREKANIIYELLNLSCRAVSIEEFLNINFKINSDMAGIATINKLVDYVKANVYQDISDDNVIRKKFDLPILYFNYFDRAQLIEEPYFEYCILYKYQGYPRNKILYRAEVRVLISDLIQNFGQDVDEFGELSDSEDLNAQYIRQWEVGYFLISLVKSEDFGYPMMVLEIEPF